MTGSGKMEDELNTGDDLGNVLTNKNEQNQKQAKMAVSKRHRGQAVSVSQASETPSTATPRQIVNQTDNGPQTGARGMGQSRQRLCIVSRELYEPEDLIRFVVGPGGTVVPDLKCKLPGRGAWVLNSRAALEKASSGGYFKRAFRKNVKFDPSLADSIVELRLLSITGKLALANKAGLVVTGFNKAIDLLNKGKVALVLHAKEAASDGRKKVATAIASHARGIDNPKEVLIFDGLDGVELDRTLGKSNIAHVVLKVGELTSNMLGEINKIVEFQDVKSTESEEVNLKIEPINGEGSDLKNVQLTAGKR